MEKRKTYKNMFWAPCIICDFIKLVWTNSKNINSNPFEFNSYGLELQPQIPESLKWFKNHGNYWNAQIFGYANFWGEGESWATCKIQTVAHLSPQHVSEFKFKRSSNSDFKFLSPHEIISTSIMPSLRCKRWNKIHGGIWNACGLLQLSPTNAGSRPEI